MKLFWRLLPLVREIFPFLVVLTYFFLLLETYLYVGFLRKFFLVDSTFFLILTILLSVMIVFQNTQKKGRAGENSFLFNFIFQLNALFFPLIIVFYIIIQASELAAYPNYIFSTFHLQPKNFFYIVFLNIELLFVSQIIKNEKILNFILLKLKLFLKDFKKNAFEKLLKFFLVLTLLFCFTNNFFTIESLAKSFIYILGHSHDSHEQKMRAQFNFFYDYMIFVKSNTEENAVIVIPPQVGPWLTSGNAGMVRYFLYPRKIVNGAYEEFSLNNVDYAFIAWGEWIVDDYSRYGWPKIPIKADKLFYFEPRTRYVEEIISDYNPLDEKNEKSWGLVKISRSEN